MRKIYILAITMLLFSGLNTSFGQDCDIYNMVGAGSLVYLQSNIGGGKMYVRYDPAAENAMGNPGCGLSYPYLLETANFGLVDAGYFTPGFGAGTLTYRISILNLANPSDLCSGPGAVLATSPVFTLSLPTGTTNIHEVGHTFNLLVSNAFFVVYEVLTWSGDQYQVPSPIRNSQAISACRQYITQNGGSLIEDHTEFFGTGWLNSWITGEAATGSCIPPSVTFTASCITSPTNFFVYADVTDLGTGSPYTISNSVNGSTASLTSAGNVFVGSFANNTNVVVTITSNANEDCSVTSQNLTLDCSSVSVEELTPLQLTELFPNPAKSVVSISTEGLTGNINLQVFDVSGKMVMQQNWMTAGNSHQIDLTKLSKGVYSFLLENDGNQMMHKLVVQ